MDVIITRYNEFINWVDYLPETVNKIYIYNKGYNDMLFKNHESKYKDKIIIQRLVNVGKMEHTIAYHIVKNWDSLPDTLIFLPGSILMNPQKGKFLGSIIRNVPELCIKHKGFYSPKFKKVSKNYNYTNSKNKALTKGTRNVNNSDLVKSQFPTFIDFKKELIDNKPIHYTCYRSMFAVAKEIILHIPKETFIKLQSCLEIGENNENTFYVERIWAHLFRQYSFFKLNQEQCEQCDQKITILTNETRNNNSSMNHINQNIETDVMEID